MKTIILYIYCVFIGSVNECNTININPSFNKNEEISIDILFSDKQSYFKINGEVYEVLPVYTENTNVYCFYTKSTLSLEVDYNKMEIRLKDIVCYNNNKAMFFTQKFKINHISSSK